MLATIGFHSKVANLRKLTVQKLKCAATLCTCTVQRAETGGQIGKYVHNPVNVYVGHHLIPL
jgi:hypothetical protein